jgi:signal transduction histidine kinase
VRTLPAEVDQAAYRVVQEALTNAARHAHAATASVEITYGGCSLTVHVQDDGTGPGKAAAPGYGLIGMRERVTALGGRLSAGPGPTRGFSVWAELPVTAS